jgi:two-component system, OmpR family, phosphate regulon sensor histidine kinase PhoR
MNRRVITIIIILTSISLIAALVTQLLWVRDAGLLKKDHYNTSVKVALRTVINEINELQDSLPSNFSGIDSVIYWEDIGLLAMLHPKILDSLLEREFQLQQIKGAYYYGVYRSIDSLFILGKYEGYTEQLILSPLQISLTCLCQSDNYWLSVYFPDKKSVMFNEMVILPVMSGLFLLVLVFSFFFTIYITVRQKKLSEMKTDFVNNMTHEFKTPISTISVTSEIMQKEQVKNSPEKVSKYAKIIFDENSRLKKMVERVLQISIIERDDLSLNLKENNVHEIIEECVEVFNIQVLEREGKIKTRLEANHPIIKTDRDHLTNILSNLIDNANKYSPENPQITIRTQNLNKRLFITVEDNGIGIAKENLKDVFKKFHRLQQGDIHDVKGFGIGLFYVKTMTTKLGGEIDLKSEPNKGSSFILSFPE